MAKYATKYNVKTHGRSEDAEFGIWWAMRQRCSNPRNKAFENYGARGIFVCDRWQKFDAFYADMGPRPSPEHSIDRIDVDSGYSADNCRWATRDEQNSNRRDTVRVMYDGKEMSLKQASRAAGLPYSTVRNRLASGYSEEDALRLEMATRVVAGSGVRGAYFHKGRARPWQAKVMVDRKSKSLGYYETAEEAGEAYQRFIQHARNAGEI